MEPVEKISVDESKVSPKEMRNIEAVSPRGSQIVDILY